MPIVWLRKKRATHYNIYSSAQFGKTEQLSLGLLFQLYPSTTMSMIFRIAALLAVLLSHSLTTADEVEVVVSNCMR
jgi:hypothetical protein